MVFSGASSPRSPWSFGSFCSDVQHVMPNRILRGNAVVHFVGLMMTGMSIVFCIVLELKTWESNGIFMVPLKFRLCRWRQLHMASSRNWNTCVHSKGSIYQFYGDLWEKFWENAAAPNCVVGDHGNQTIGKLSSSPRVRWLSLKASVCTFCSAVPGLCEVGGSVSSAWGGGTAYFEISCPSCVSFCATLGGGW